MLTKEEVQKLEDQKVDLNYRISKKEDEKKLLYQENQENVDLRNAAGRKAARFTLLGIVFLILSVDAALYFKLYYLIAFGVALLIVFLVLRKKPAAIEKDFSAGLVDYDKKVSAINVEIKNYEKEIKAIEEKLEQQRIIDRYAAYAENHICVYVGRSVSKLMSEKAQATADHYDPVEEVTVYIDGVEYGGMELPFGAFEVEPGLHTVKIDCYTNYGGVIKHLESKAKQVKVSGGSLFLFYHWNFYWKNKVLSGNELHQELFLNIYDNVYDFLIATHQFK